MLDVVIRSKNNETMTKEELGDYFDKMTAEIDEYVYAENGPRTTTKDFKFDAMSLVSWTNVLEVIGTRYTPFQPIAQIKSLSIEHKNMRKAGTLAREIMDVQRKAGVSTYLRTDVSASIKTMKSIHEGNMYPGLKRGLLKSDRIDIDDELKVAQFLSPNPQYIFIVQFFYPGAWYYDYRVENSKIVTGPEKHREFVEMIITKLIDRNIAPRHPQYNEHGTRDVSFSMTVVDGPDGPEVFTASAYGIVNGKELAR